MGLSERFWKWQGPRRDGITTRGALLIVGGFIGSILLIAGVIALVGLIV